MYNIIYIICPPGKATGGTELLHQLQFQLNQMGQKAFMIYDGQYEGSGVQKAFNDKYQVKRVDTIEDSSENLIVVPENKIKWLLRYKNIQKAIWWLSVDNYNGANKIHKSYAATIYRFFLDQYYRLFDKKYQHYVQSEYARLYVTEDRHVPANQVHHLSDYLNSAFIEDAKKETSTIRKNNILYNPVKGFETTSKLMEMLPQYNWIAIRNMTPAQICDLMKESKLYIDFGNHPGKDRMPREAAICGCCVITGRRGAAANDIDVLIPSKYKFQDTDFDAISSQMDHVMKNFDTCTVDFISYRDRISNEEDSFKEEIKSCFLK